jgi:hypothetical protein
LQDLGIFSISLKYHLSPYVDANGNHFRYKAAVSDEAGPAYQACYDVALTIQALESQ